MGTYLTRGQWAIGTKESLTFRLFVLTLPVKKLQSVSPLLGIIQLDTGCHAANNFLSLPPPPPYYIFEEQVTLIDPNQKLLEIHNSNLSCI